MYFVDGAPVVNSANKKDMQLNISHVPSEKNDDPWVLDDNSISSGNSTDAAWSTS